MNGAHDGIGNRRAAAEQVSAAPTGAAAIIAPSVNWRSARTAASMVAPVASPSSTRMTVRPFNGGNARPLWVRAVAAIQLHPLARDNLLDYAWRDARFVDDVPVQHADAPFGDRAHRQLGVERDTDLSDEEHIEGQTERVRTSYATGTPPRGRASTMTFGCPM